MQIHLLLVLGLVLLVGEALSAATGSSAGIYVQISKLSPSRNVCGLVASNPLVTGVLLPVNWKAIEPVRGHFDFSQVEEALAYWGSQNKKVILQPTLYGQNPEEDQTPDWLYSQSDVQAISFSGGGRARGKFIRVPAVWKEGFVDTYIKPLAQALASHVDGDPALAFIQVA